MARVEPIEPCPQQEQLSLESTPWPPVPITAVSGSHGLQDGIGPQAPKLGRVKQCKHLGLKSLLPAGL